VTGRFEVTRVGVDGHRYDRYQDQSREGMAAVGLVQRFERRLEGMVGNSFGARVRWQRRAAGGSTGVAARK